MNACLLAICLLGQVATTPPETSQTVPDWAQMGNWNSKYESLGAGIIESQVVFSGTTGEYTVGVSKGRLSNIKYTKSFRHAVGPPTPAIYGTWELLLYKGYFVFRAPDKQGVFDGYFGFYAENGDLGQVVGSWDAVRRPDPPQSKEL